MLGGKGGVGKTLFSLHLWDWLNVQKVSCAAMDCESENRSNSLAHAINAKRVSLGEKWVGNAALVDALAQAQEAACAVALVDAPAASGNSMAAYLATLADGLKEARIDLNCCVILTTEPATHEQYLTYTAALGEKAEFTVVKNQYRGEVVIGKSVSAALTSSKATEIDMESHRDDLFADMLARGGMTPATLPMVQADKKGALLSGLAARLEVGAIAKKMHTQFDEKAAAFI